MVPKLPENLKLLCRVLLFDRLKRWHKVFNINFYNFKAMRVIQSDNALVYVQSIQLRIEELMNHLRNDMSKIKEERAKALFEASADVLEGLHKAFTHYTKDD